MADVFRTVNGRKLTKIIAMHRTVQGRLDEEALKAGVRAEARLRSHEDTGASRITVDTGKVDRYVALDDTRGQRAAMSIEYGRQADENGHGAMQGLWILHEAFGLPHGT